jgi:hypothetical protein
VAIKFYMAEARLITPIITKLLPSKISVGLQLSRLSQAKTFHNVLKRAQMRREPWDSRATLYLGEIFKVQLAKNTNSNILSPFLTLKSTFSGTLVKRVNQELKLAIFKNVGRK